MVHPRYTSTLLNPKRKSPSTGCTGCRTLPRAAAGLVRTMDRSAQAIVPSDKGMGTRGNGGCSPWYLAFSRSMKSRPLVSTSRSTKAPAKPALCTNDMLYEYHRLRTSNSDDVQDLLGLSVVVRTAVLRAVVLVGLSSLDYIADQDGLAVLLTGGKEIVLTS